MKKYFVIASVVVAMIVAACSEKETNPLWGMWILKSTSPIKTEIMFNDDNTGFVFVADTVRFETSWQQDSLLNVHMFDMTVGKSLGMKKSYRVTIDGNEMKMENVKTGNITEYTRFVE
ncbi:MAG: hypothetical protein IJW68_04025 [Bacteroidaceae bacterium]|nr:hypothetical protein [Bacteroidaceae bacterium]